MANKKGIYIYMDQSFIRRYASLSDEEFGKVVCAALTNAKDGKIPAFTGKALNAFQDLQRQKERYWDFDKNAVGGNRWTRKDRSPAMLRLYMGILNGFSRLTDEQAGKMVRDVMQYTIDGTMPKLSQKSKPVFQTMIGWLRPEPRPKSRSRRHSAKT